MTATKQGLSVPPSQAPSQIGHPRLISPGDFTYLLAASLLSGMQLLPASQRVTVINRISVLLAKLLYAMNAHCTRTIRHNLHALFGKRRMPDLLESDLRQILSITLWNSLIMHTLPALSREQIANLVPVDGLSCVDEYLDGNHPVLIWGYHFGVHPLIVVAMLRARGYPILAISHLGETPAGATFCQRMYLNRLRPIGKQIPVTNPREGLKRNMLDALKNHECLYYTPDYMMPEDECQAECAFLIPVDFLNRKTHLQVGSLRLAKRLGAQVVAVLSAQDTGEQQRLVVEPFDWPTPGLTPGELQHDLQVCMQRLEAQVLAHPYMWWDLKRDDLLERLKGPTRDEYQDSSRHQ